MAHIDGGDPALSSHNLATQTLGATWRNLPQLLAAALALNLCLAPALLFAFLGFGAAAVIAGALLATPGWVALQHFEMGLLQGKAMKLSALAGNFHRFWLRSMRLGVLALALPVLTWFAGAWLGDRDGLGASLVTPVLITGILASLLVGSLIILYAVPLLVSYEQELPIMLRNAAILAAHHISNTVGMVALAVLCVLATVYLSSGLLFVLPTLYGMFVANNCRLVIQQES